MGATDFKLSSIRNIDNSRSWLPWSTFFLLVALIIIGFWFLKGGSFRLYASVFFTLYHFTGQIWVSVILIGVLQNLFFLPLRFIGLRMSIAFDNFESKLEKISNEKEQYFLFTKQVKEGNPAIVFYIFNFFVNAIAFISAGRLFLIDFYNVKLDPRLLYNFVHYPQYPLVGTDFHFPFFKIIESYAVKWSTIIYISLAIIAFLFALRLIWRILKRFLWRNKTILSFRISYNRLLLKIVGFVGTSSILLIIFLRHIPTSFEGFWLIADLTRQNNTMNFITAIGTFITTLHAGYVKHSLAAKEATANKMPAAAIEQIFKEKMQNSFKNALILGVGAYLITNHIPCAFELSIATFEFIYIISPITFDLIVPRSRKPAPTLATTNA